MKKKSVFISLFLILNFTLFTLFKVNFHSLYGYDLNLSNTLRNMTIYKIDKFNVTETNMFKFNKNKSNTTFLNNYAIESPNSSSLSLSLKGVENTRVDQLFYVNVHLLGGDFSETIESIDYVVKYDPSLFEFIGVESGNIEKLYAGKVRINSIINKSFYKVTNDNNYAKSRIGKLCFKTIKDVYTESSIIIQNPKITANKKIINEDNLFFSETSLKVKINKSLNNDVNKDGLLSIGDIALLSNKKSTSYIKKVSKTIKFTPYKRVLLIGVDGAGLGFKPDAPYFGKSNLAKTRNIPFMESLCKKSSISFDAKVAPPSFSAPGWTSILHGINYFDVPKEYQVHNDTASEYYFKNDGAYPSIFKVLGDATPNRRMAAYVWWREIIEGIIENNVGVECKYGKDSKVFDETINYIKSGKMKDTSIFFLELNDVDEAGHIYGWYKDEFYSALNDADNKIEKVVRALKDENLLDDTLLIVAADHGGFEKSHGIENFETMGTFMLFHGPLIVPNQVLKGGMIRDIPPIITSILEHNKGEGWSGGVFDKRMFINQVDNDFLLNQNKEAVNLKPLKHSVILEVNNITTPIKAIDLTFDLNNVPHNNIKVFSGKGVKILKEEFTENSLRVLALFSKGINNFEEILKIEVKSKDTINILDTIKIKNVMLANDKGEEILPKINH